MNSLKRYINAKYLAKLNKLKIMIIHHEKSYMLFMLDTISMESLFVSNTHLMMH